MLEAVVARSMLLVSEATNLVSKASNLSAEARIFSGPKVPEILVLHIFVDLFPQVGTQDRGQVYRLTKCE